MGGKIGLAAIAADVSLDFHDASRFAVECDGFAQQFASNRDGIAGIE
jgi:hypothetical protein